MASSFVLAVASDGHRRVVREGRKEIEQASGVGTRHLGAVLPLEGLPRPIVVARGPRFLDEGLTRRQLGQPDVVEVARREVRLRHASRRTADGPDPKPFARAARAPESDDGDGHGSLRRPSYGADEGSGARTTCTMPFIVRQWPGNVQTNG